MTDELRTEARRASSICRIIQLAPENHIKLTAQTENWRYLPFDQLDTLHAIFLSRQAGKERTAQAKKQQLQLSF